MADWKPDDIEFFAMPVKSGNFGFAKAIDHTAPGRKVVILQIRDVEGRYGEKVSLDLALPPDVAIDMSRQLYSAGTETSGDVH